MLVWRKKKGWPRLVYTHPFLQASKGGMSLSLGQVATVNCTYLEYYITKQFSLVCRCGRHLLVQSSTSQYNTVHSVCVADIGRYSAVQYNTVHSVSVADMSW